MSVQASVVLTTARTLLNDDAASFWTDTVLMPKLAQAHRELQAKLRFAGSPIMRGLQNDILVNANAVTLTLPADLIEPIRLWEKAIADPQTGYVLMTESDPLPIQAVASTLIYWQWGTGAEAVNFIGASANRNVKLQYWRALPIPVVNTDLIQFINGELYLAPRVAALAAGSTGDDSKAAVFTNATALANESLSMVILANRGRMPPASGSTARP